MRTRKPSTLLALLQYSIHHNNKRKNFSKCRQRITQFEILQNFRCFLFISIIYTADGLSSIFFAEDKHGNVAATTGDQKQPSIPHPALPEKSNICLTRYSSDPGVHRTVSHIFALSQTICALQKQLCPAQHSPAFSSQRHPAASTHSQTLTADHLSTKLCFEPYIWTPGQMGAFPSPP